MPETAIREFVHNLHEYRFSDTVNSSKSDAPLGAGRENSFSDKAVEWSAQEPSPGGASANSPALQRREKWGRYASPGGTTEVLTHTR